MLHEFFPLQFLHCLNPMGQPPYCYQNIPIQRRVIPCQSNRVLTDIITNIRVIIPESVVIQSRLSILVLSDLPKRNKIPVALQITKVPVIIVYLPNKYAYFRKFLYCLNNDLILHILNSLCQLLVYLNSQNL